MSSLPLSGFIRMSRGEFSNSSTSYQTPGMHLPFGFSAALAQGLQEARPVCVVLENGFAPVPAVHQVVNRPGRPEILHSEFSRHAPSHAPTRHLCQCLGLTLTEAIGLKRPPICKPGQRSPVSPAPRAFRCFPTLSVQMLDNGFIVSPRLDAPAGNGPFSRPAYPNSAASSSPSATGSWRSRLDSPRRTARSRKDAARSRM